MIYWLVEAVTDKGVVKKKWVVQAPSINPDAQKVLKSIEDADEEGRAEGEPIIPKSCSLFAGPLEFEYHTPGGYPFTEV